MTYTPNPPTSLEVKREERERREARDRILAREVGIEIGRRRERERLHREKDKAWGRGFIIGLLVALIFMLVGWYGAEKTYASTNADNPQMSAYVDIVDNQRGADISGHAIKTRIGSGASASWAVYRLGERTMPPAWRTFLRICQLEQPGPGWRGVWWRNTENHSFPGGCGLTRQNYTEVKHPAWPDTADRLQPRDQLWASFWLYWKYARIGQELRGSYEGGQRYGATVWDVHTQLGFHGFKADGKTPN